MKCHDKENERLCESVFFLIVKVGISIVGLWRECAAWLTRCKVIPIEHKANANESEIRVLALTLRDGVLLCNLINFLDPKAGLDFNRKPQMAQV